jgi:oligogalacturonide transporter
MDNARTVRLKNIIAYGIGDLYGGGSFFLISTFSMFYLINVVGLSPIWAGLVPGLGKVWDAVSDPLMGYISDRSRSRYGRRRLYFLLAIAPVAVTFALLWLPVSFDTQVGTFLYYFMAYLFFYTVSTMTMVPYSALSAEMTLDFNTRNRLTGARMIFSLFSSLLAGALAQPIINAFPDPARGHLIMGAAFGVLFAVPWIFVFLGTWELPHAGRETELEANFYRNFKTIFANRSFRIHIGMYICSYAAMDVLMSWFKFYIIDYLGRLGFVPIGLVSIVLTELVVLPLYIRYANRKGHGRAYIAGLAIWALAMALMAIQTPASPLPLLVLNCVLIGAGMSAGVVIPWTILPFITDVDELITSKKRAGTYAGSMTLIRKLIQGALVIPFLGVLLSAIGYVVPTAQQIAARQAVQQSAQTIAMVRVLFFLIPLVLIAGGIMLATRFRITPATHAVLIREINRLRDGGKKVDADAHDRRVCEELTGVPYDKLYEYGDRKRA